MAHKKKLPKCRKCGHGTLGVCDWCGDPYCYYHLHNDQLEKRTCSNCSVKYYRMWLEENEDATKQQEEYETWLRRMVERESAIG